MGEKTPPLVSERLFALVRSVGRSSYGPTPTNLETMALIQKECESFEEQIEKLRSGLDQVDSALERAGAPPVKK